MIFIYIKESMFSVSIIFDPRHYFLTDYSGLGTCGERPTYSRIVGGVDAIYGEWPFIGSLGSRGGHVCGATLINPGWAVTAAHCL